MFSRALLASLFRHMEWADATVWNAVPADSADDRLRLWLVHIHVVQRAFLQVWTEGPIEIALRRPDDFATMTDIREWARPYYREVEAFIDGVADDRLDRIVALPWAGEVATHLGREPGPSTLGETCFQVTSHSTYHRGQVNARLREIGAEPPLVDYIGWLWLGRPQPPWPA